jgi:hypothetical protein
VPVREIARLAGVTERTLYKYVEKGGWRRRYVCRAREGTVAAVHRGRRLVPSPRFVPVKGAGGRFIPREEAGRPHPSGLKALDPDGARQAIARCARAALLSETAAAQAVAEREARAALAKAKHDDEAEMRAIESIVMAVVELGKLEQEMETPSSRAQDLLSRLAMAISRALTPRGGRACARVGRAAAGTSRP